MIRLRKALGLTASAVVLAACSDSTGPDGDGGPGPAETVEWSGQIAPGGTVEIKGTSGDIRAVPAAGSAVRVTARKRGDADDPSSVRIDVVQHPGGVTICAVYPDVQGLPPNECLPGLFNGQLSSRDNDVEVTFDVQVPAGSDFVGRTMGGDVEATGLDGEVVASSMAGDIDISTSGLAVGTAMHGDVTASIGLPNWDRDLWFTSMNGNVTVRIPAATNAQVSGMARGSISTDFPLTITRQGAFRRVSGSLGSGGRRLMLSTSDGNIVLHSQ